MDIFEEKKTYRIRIFEIHNSQLYGLEGTVSDNLVNKRPSSSISDIEETEIPAIQIQG